VALLKLLPKESKNLSYSGPDKISRTALDSNQLSSNVAPPTDKDPIAVGSIPSAWLAVYAAKWALFNEQDRKYATANEKIRLIILSQFFGILQPKELGSKDPGFQRLFGLLRDQDPAKGQDGSQLKLLVWRLISPKSPHDGRIVAGSHPGMIFFPAASLEDAVLPEMKAEIDRRVGDLVDWSKSILDDGFVSHPIVAGVLAEYLDVLCGAPNQAVGSEWRQALGKWSKQLNKQSTSGSYSQNRKSIAQSLSNGWPQFQTIDLRDDIAPWDQIFALSTRRLSRPDRDVVDWPVDGKWAKVVTSCNHGADGWTVTLSDGRKKWKAFPVVADEKQVRTAVWGVSTILVWPHKTAAGWNINYIAASTNEPREARYKVLFQRWKEKEQTSSSDRASMKPSTAQELEDELRRTNELEIDRLYRIDGEIKFVELGELDEDGNFISLGLLKLDRGSAIPESQDKNIATVVLDFGTSNSVVLWSTVDGQSSFVKFGTSFEDFVKEGHRLTYDDQTYQNLCAAVAALPMWYFPPINTRDRNGKTKQVPDSNFTPFDFLPSLLALPEKSAAVEDIGASGTIPARKRSLTLLGKEGRRRFVSALKWANWDSGDNSAHLRSLLELLLLPALWALREAGVAKWRLEATYPLAFSQEQRRKYAEVLKDLCEELDQFTGTKIQSDGDVFATVRFSESEAGAASCLQAGGDLAVTLDLGGGTLDVAVFTRERDVGSFKKKTLIAFDSLKYGGRDFLHAALVACASVVKSIFAQEVPPRVAERAKDPYEFYIECLEAEIQEPPYPWITEILSLKIHELEEPRRIIEENNFRKYYRDEIACRAEALLSGIVLYIRRLVEGAVGIAFSGDTSKSQPLHIDFYLLGQGWGLIPPMLNRPAENGSPVQLMTQRLANALGQQISVHPAANGTNKSTTLNGFDPLAKTAVTRGAAVLCSVQQEMKRSELVNAWIQGGGYELRPTFVGMNFATDSGQPLLDANKPLCRRVRAEEWSGKLSRESQLSAYKTLVDTLFEHIPEGGFDTREKTRELLKELDPEDKRLVEWGVDLLNREWLQPNNMLTRSLLGMFLEESWLRLWSKVSRT